MISFQLPKCEYFLISLVVCDSKLKVFGFWTVGQDKTTDFLGCMFGFGQHFSLFYGIL